MQSSLTTGETKLPLDTRPTQQRKYLQLLCQKIALDRQYQTIVEQDLILTKEGIKIACIICISVTGQEVINAERLLNKGCSYVFVISPLSRNIQRLRRAFKQKLDPTLLQHIAIMRPEQFLQYLDQIDATVNSCRKVNGYTIIVRYKTLDSVQTNAQEHAIAEIILNTLKRIKSR